MNQHLTPLYDALMDYHRLVRYSFHVPGHKNGESFPTRGKDMFESLLQIDATEVAGLDDLFNPQGAIKQSQELLSDFYNTKRSYFLVNGSTVGNLAMILATCQRGDHVFVQRNSHKSIFNGLRLAGAEPIFLMPEVNDETLIPTGVSHLTLQEAITTYPDTKVLILTYPNYYGMAYDYQSVIQTAREHGIIVLVDEAHGAHFSINNQVPNSTLKMGADMVVQSAHKMLPAMTMGAYLHINNNLINFEKVEEALATLQTSSPSYPIMASLDLARYTLATLTKDMMEDYLNKINDFKRQINDIPQFKVIDLIEDRYLTIDPFKVIIQSQCELSAIECQQVLLNEGIYIELASGEHLLLVLPVYPNEHFLKSARVMKQAMASYKLINKALPSIHLKIQAVSKLECQYDIQDKLKTKSVLLDNAVGEVSSQDVIPYPPGIPILMKGEKIIEEHIQLISHLIKDRVPFQGMDFDNQRMLEVIDFSTKGER